jgi:uncharacterized protein
MRDIVRFIIVTYAISWAFWGPMVVTGEHRALLIPGTFGPLAAALLLTARDAGWAGIRGLLGSLRTWRVDARWYLFIFLAPPAIVLAAIWLHVLLGGDRPAFNDPAGLWLVLPVFLYVLVFSVAGEEAGWRGYLLPRAQRRWGPLAASLVIGVVWGLWHLPLFLVAGNLHEELPLSLFLLQDVALAVLFTWMWNGTGGSLLLAHLFHAAVNTTLGVLPVLPMDTGGAIRPLWIAVGMLVVVAVFVTVVDDLARPAWGRRAR